MALLLPRVSLSSGPADSSRAHQPSRLCGRSWQDNTAGCGTGSRAETPRPKATCAHRRTRGEEAAGALPLAFRACPGQHLGLSWLRGLRALPGIYQAAPCSPLDMVSSLEEALQLLQHPWQVSFSLTRGSQCGQRISRSQSALGQQSAVRSPLTPGDRDLGKMLSGYTLSLIPVKPRTVLPSASTPPCKVSITCPLPTCFSFAPVF